MLPMLCGLVLCGSACDASRETRLLMPKGDSRDREQWSQCGCFCEDGGFERNREVGAHGPMRSPARRWEH